jgi:hypothetical protein
VWGFGIAGRFDGWATPVVGVVLVRDKHAGPRDVFVRGRGAVRELPDTLLGFETTGPSPLRPVVGGTGGDSALSGVGLVVALLWWWGVVFDLWIVVASIWHACGAGPFLGLVFSCVLMCNFQSFV